MSLSAPFDILADFPGWVTDFDAPARQEQSLTAGGRTITKDLGPPLWKLTAISKSLRPSDLDEWRARIGALASSQQLMFGYSLSKVWPRLYPRGTWPTGGSYDGSAQLGAIHADRKTIRLTSMPNGFQLSVGDFVQIGEGDLHRVREATSVSSGATGEFEIYPNLWPGVVSGASASIYRAHCLMTIVPGSVSAQADPSTGRGSVSFKAMEARL